MDQQVLETSIPKKRNRTASRDARRKQLIEATIESIATHGFNKTTVNTVTDIAKLSHGTVNFHFKSKDSLLLETMKYLTDEHLNHWKAGLAKADHTPEAQLRALVSTDFDKKIINTKRLAVWFAYWGEVSNRPAYREIAGSKDHERHEVIKDICVKLNSNNDYPHIDGEDFTNSLEALVDGLWLQLLLCSKDITPKQAKANCLTFLASTFPKHFSFPAR